MQITSALSCTCLLPALLCRHWIIPDSWFLDGKPAQHGGAQIVVQHMQRETLLIMQPVKTSLCLPDKAHLSAVMATSGPLCQDGRSKNLAMLSRSD